MSADVSRDWDITSFDGTVIRAHWFPIETLAAGETAPTVLMGPGWGSGGDTDADTVGLLGSLSISSLRDAGYNVLTWDPRGFGESSGTVQIDSVEYEARDVQQLLDWVSTQPQAELDGDRDPRSGMVGGSYGGGIQLVTAAIDCRVDALVPIVAWHSLTTSLYKAETFKAGWANLLAAGAMTADLDPTIGRSTEAGNATGVLDPADVEWFAERGPSDLVADITVPTFVIQGTVDTLFTLDEGVSNYEMLRASGVPTAMMWFCGGHGTCLSTASPDEARVGSRAIAWLDRYVKGDETVEFGATFDFVDQHGVNYTADDFPRGSEGAPITGTGGGAMALVADGGSGPAVALSGGGVISQFSAAITPGAGVECGRGEHGDGTSGGGPDRRRARADHHLFGDDPRRRAADAGVRPVGRPRDRSGARQPDHPDRRRARRRHAHRYRAARDGGPLHGLGHVAHRPDRRDRPSPMPCPASAGAWCSTRSR